MPLTSTPKPRPSGTSSIAFLLRLALDGYFIATAQSAAIVRIPFYASPRPDVSPSQFRSASGLYRRLDAGCPCRPRGADETLWQRDAGAGGYHRGPGRRRADVECPPSQHSPRHADLRHEPRYGGLPAEPVSRGWPARPPEGCPENDAHPPAHGRDDHPRPAP